MRQSDRVGASTRFIYRDIHIGSSRVVQAHRSFTKVMHSLAYYTCAVQFHDYTFFVEYSFWRSEPTLGLWGLMSLFLRQSSKTPVCVRTFVILRRLNSHWGRGKWKFAAWRETSARFYYCEIIHWLIFVI